jgi:hypothetical protein
MSLTTVDLRDTHRLVPGRHPATGILDRVTSPTDLEAVVEIEGWTDDRVSTELGILRRIPQADWVLGAPFATVIMAAFCHPRTGGGRFNDHRLGAWYAAFDLETAHREVIHHRTLDLEEIGLPDARIEVHDYLADFQAIFHDVRAPGPEHDALHDPSGYEVSQRFAGALRESGSNGVLYRSVRRPGGSCIACFKPRLVSRVRPSGRFEYRWAGAREPIVRPLPPVGSP